MRSMLLGLAGLLAASAAAADTGSDTVKLGLILDLSSVQADAAGSGAVTAAQMAVEDFGGKLLGKPIQVMSADHQLKPDLGSAIARRWIDEEGVDAFVEVQNSAVAVATVNLARDANKVIMFSSAGSTDLTGKYCSPVSAHWTWDAHSSVQAIARPLVEQGEKTWFFITPDYNFGKALIQDATRLIKSYGGEVIGEVRVPMGTADYSSALLQAQASGADVIAIAGSGGDAATNIKQAAEYGITTGGDQKVVSIVTSVTEIEAIGLETAQGILLPEAFYWDLNDQTREFSKRFRERTGQYPNQFTGGIYSSVSHFLKAAEAAGTTEGDAVIAKMREIPINDMMTENGRLREDGRVLRNIYLFQVKSPEESSYDHDFYKLVATVPGEQAFKPLSESECEFIKN